MYWSELPPRTKTGIIVILGGMFLFYFASRPGTNVPSAVTPAERAVTNDFPRQIEKWEKEANAAVERNDYATALRIVKPLAEQGNAHAQSFLASMYIDGTGVPKDYAEAFKWYRRAADKGDYGGQFGLSNMYLWGWGVPKDYVLSYLWLNLAAQNKEPATEPGKLTPGQVAAELRDNMASHMMSAEQRAKATELAANWKPEPFSDTNEIQSKPDYASISVEDFVLDGKDLAEKSTRVAIRGVYIREGNLDVLYRNQEAAMRAYYSQQGQIKVGLLIDDASRELRKRLLKCQSDQQIYHAGCQVTVRGRATSCTITSAFGASRTQPCLAAEDGQ